MTISFEESIFGVDKEISITKTSVCNTCSGSGAKPNTKVTKCKTCNGQGQIRENRQTVLGVMSTTRVCKECDGQGEIPEEKCTTCKGVGVLKKTETLSVKIPSGINSGEMIRLTHMGEAIRGGESGDLYIRVYVSKHKIFSREGNNLIMPLTVKLTDALLGVDQTIETLDGKVTIKIPQGVSHGEILRVREKGVPVGKSKRGDLLIPIKISIPQKLNKKEKELILDLQKEGL
jgi:molecular chaperone DnaJ